MKAKILNDGPERVFALVFEKGEEAVAALKSFAEMRQLSATHFTAIGAFEDVVLGYFDRSVMEYKRIPLHEQVEVLILDGDVTTRVEDVQVHAHVVVGRSDGTTRGGHLLEGRVWPTLEVIMEESPVYLRRKIDPETGIALIDITA